MRSLKRKRKNSDDQTPVKKSKLSLKSDSFKNNDKDINICDKKSLDIFVWGTGSMCELGLGPLTKNKQVKRPRLNAFLTKEALMGSAIVDFAVGGMHVLALDNKNRVWSWGGNDYGVLGRETNINTNKDNDDENENENEINELESTPDLVKNLTNINQKIVQLIATDNLSAVLYENGDVHAWGCFRCNEGLLGFLRDEIKIQKTPKKIEELKNIILLAPGKDHLLALNKKGIVYAWGNGQQYQLGRKIIERHRYSTLQPQQFGLSNIRYIASGDFHCFAIDNNDNVYAWGLNQYGQCAITKSNGQLEDGFTIKKPTEVKSLLGKKIKSIVAGEHHSIALTNDGEVFSWGRCDMKELGISSEKLPKSCFKDSNNNIRAVPEPTKIEFHSSGNKCEKIKTIGCGSHHSFAISNLGIMYSWGFADTYALGLGPIEEDVETPTRIINTAVKYYDINIVSGGGQFSVCGGVKITNDDELKKRDLYLEENQ